MNLKGIRGFCSNNRKDKDAKNSSGQPKKCSAALCFRPKTEKISIIEEKRNKKGKAVFKIDPNTPDDELFKPENYEIYHNHKGIV